MQWQQSKHPFFFQEEKKETLKNLKCRIIFKDTITAFQTELIYKPQVDHRASSWCWPDNKSTWRQKPFFFTGGLIRKILNNLCLSIIPEKFITDWVFLTRGGTVEEKGRGGTIALSGRGCWSRQQLSQQSDQVTDEEGETDRFKVKSPRGDAQTCGVIGREWTLTVLL